MAQEFAEARRPGMVTGAPALRELPKLSMMTYDGSSKQRIHAEFIADRIDEVVSLRTVDMLDALPEDEAAFYRDEANVVDWTGKSQILKETDSTCSGAS